MYRRLQIDRILHGVAIGRARPVGACIGITDHAAFERYAPNVALDGASMIAWSSGKLLEAAVDALGAEARSGPLTTALIMKGLGKIKNETNAEPFAPATRAASATTSSDRAPCS